MGYKLLTQGGHERNLALTPSVHKLVVVVFIFEVTSRGLREAAAASGARGDVELATATPGRLL